MAARLLTDFELMLLLAALDRLDTQGLVASTLGQPTAERGGRAKRYFILTARGLHQVKQVQRALQALWNGIPELKETRA